jgi:predicted permease
MGTGMRAGLFVRGPSGVGRTDMGFDVDGLLVARLQVDGGADFEGHARRDYFERAEERLARLPFVRSVSSASATPLRMSHSFHLSVPGLDSLPPAPTGGPYGYAVSPGYFETMGIRVVRGRAFAGRDVAGSEPVIVVNEAFAARIWPGADALGRCVYVDPEDGTAPPCAQVVGIVENARRDGIQESPNALYYGVSEQATLPASSVSLFIRVRNDGGASRAAIRSTLLELDPRVRHADVQPLLDFAAYEMRRWRLGATLFTIFGLIALLVATLGLYSVLSFDVAQRIREIGLRSALGARVPDLLALVVGRAAGITAVGIALGTGVALLLAPRLEDLLYAVGPRDPLTFVAVSLLLFLVAGIAATVPALRAARVDPNVALRAD